MMKNIILIACFFYAPFTYSLEFTEVDVCNYFSSIPSVDKMLGLSDCNLARSLVENKDVQSFYQKQVYGKIADKLTTQMKQSIEEVVLLDQYFQSSPEGELSAGTNNLKESCQLNKISEAEKCPSKKIKDQDSYQYKLNLLRTKSFDKIESSCSKKIAFPEGSSLQKILTLQARQILGKENTGNSCNENKSCPISGATGAFILKGQLNTSAAKDIFSKLKLNDFKYESNFTIFDSYPQFKLIKNAKKDKQLIEYLKIFNGKEEDQLKYINDFIFKKNSDDVFKALSAKCESFNKNIEKFLCEDDLLGADLASLNKETSLKLLNIDPSSRENVFNDINSINDKKDKLNSYIGFGFLCLSDKEKPKKDHPNIDPSNEKSLLDELFGNVTKDTRQVNPDVDAAERTSSMFCSIYNCKSKSVRESEVCKKSGGPLNSNDLKTIFKCDTEFCNQDILQDISFLEGLERRENGEVSSTGQPSEASSQSGKEGHEKKMHLSSFMQNYLGGEGVLVVEGVRPTPAKIAERSKQIAEVVSKSIPHQEAKKVEAPGPIAAAPLPTQVPPSSPSEASAPSSANSSYRSGAVNSSPASRGIATSSRVSTKSKVIVGDKNYSNEMSKNDKEIQDMREELEKLTKGTKALSDSNAQYIPSDKGGVNPQDSAKAMSDADKRRVQELRAQEESFQRRQRDLDQRERDREEYWRNKYATAAAVASVEAAAASANKREGDQAKTTGAGTEASVPTLKLNASGKNGNAEKAADISVKKSSNGDAYEVTLASTDLANLTMEKLKELKVNSKTSFIIKVLFEKKIYFVPVSMVTYPKSNGSTQSILTPIFSDANKAIAEKIIDSPVFNDYRSMMIERKKGEKL